MTEFERGVRAAAKWVSKAYGGQDAATAMLIALLPPVAPAGDREAVNAAWEQAVQAFRRHDGMEETKIRAALEAAAPILAAPVAQPAEEKAVVETAKAEGMDEAADFVLEHLAKALDLTTFEPQEGTETWDGDVVATLNHILIAAGVVDDETGSLRILHPEHSAVIDAAAKYAEQRRIGRLFTDQDVLDACAALSRARAGSEAQ